MTSLTAFTPIVSPNVGAALGWLGCAVILTALCNRFLPWPKGCRDNSLIFSGLIVLMLLPVGEHPGLAAGLHGMLGVPSGTLMVLAGLTCLNKAWPPLPGRRGSWLLLGLLLLYYALSLGLGHNHLPDPYFTGFLAVISPGGLWLVLGSLGYWLYRRQQTGWLIILTLNLIFWRTGLLPSRNLWDVLVDPMLLGVLGWHAYHQPVNHLPTLATTSPSDPAA